MSAWVGAGGHEGKFASSVQAGHRRLRGGVPLDPKCLSDIMGYPELLDVSPRLVLLTWGRSGSGSRPDLSRERVGGRGFTGWVSKGPG